MNRDSLLDYLNLFPSGASWGQLGIMVVIAVVICVLLVDRQK